MADDGTKLIDPATEAHLLAALRVAARAKMKVARYDQHKHKMAAVGQGQRRLSEERYESVDRRHERYLKEEAAANAQFIAIFLESQGIGSNDPERALHDLRMADNPVCNLYDTLRAHLVRMVASEIQNEERTP